MIPELVLDQRVIFYLQINEQPPPSVLVAMLPKSGTAQLAGTLASKDLQKSSRSPAMAPVLGTTQLLWTPVAMAPVLGTTQLLWTPVAMAPVLGATQLLWDPVDMALLLGTTQLLWTPVDCS